MDFMMHLLGEGNRVVPILSNVSRRISKQDSLAKMGCLVSSSDIISYG